MSRVLVLFAHPAIHRSRVHRRLVRAARATPGVTFHDLYDAYPDFDVDVAREQELLVAHDVFVLQHPMYWYSVPALVKQWMDLVLEHGWAYGAAGEALQGKRLLAALSTGGGAASYCAEGGQGYSLEQFLLPLSRTAALCGIEWLPPFVIHGAHSLDEAAIDEAARAYASRLSSLRDDLPEHRPAGAR